MSSFASLTLKDFLAQLAAKTPAPGGGAVASATGAIASGLARMVVAYSIGKKNLAEHQPALHAADASLQAFGAVMLRLADEDAAAYALLNELQKLPETDPRRQADFSAASQAALAAPRASFAAACDLLRLLETLAPITNRYLRSDLAIAAVLAEGAAKSAWWNVLVNLSLLPAESDRAAVRDSSLAMLAEAADRRQRIESACAQ